MVEIRKITRCTLGLKENMVNFRRIAERIASNGVKVVWVVGGPEVVSQ